MIKTAVVGAGKMGLSHLSIARAHPDVDLAAVCDSSSYVLDILGKYTGLKTFTDVDKMFDAVDIDALIVSTPSHLHAGMVDAAIERNIDVFCEKPFCVDVATGRRLADAARAKGLVTQVGYHNRFVASFREVRRLLDSGAIGEVTHALAESYGPVVLKSSGGSWRTRRATAGGCLYDYAAHAVDLLTWYLGAPSAARGSVVNSIFSKETDDEVYSTLHFPSGKTAQISVNWSDESERKMTTKVTFWGTKGRIYADRQEIRVYLRDQAQLPEGYRAGWNVRYTTDLTDPPWFYVRGEEYSAKIDSFMTRIRNRDMHGSSTFDTAAITDATLDMILTDSMIGETSSIDQPTVRPRFKWLRRKAG
jgi:scyllo-inositol 2-dehydrogenase (NADP+)